MSVLHSPQENNFTARISIEKESVATTKAPIDNIPDSMVHGAHMGPIGGRQDLGGPHVGPINFAIWDSAAEMKPCACISNWIIYYCTKCDY